MNLNYRLTCISLLCIGLLLVLLPVRVRGQQKIVPPFPSAGAQMPAAPAFSCGSDALLQRFRANPLNKAFEARVNEMIRNGLTLRP